MCGGWWCVLWVMMWEGVWWMMMCGGCWCVLWVMMCDDVWWMMMCGGWGWRWHNLPCPRWTKHQSGWDLCTHHSWACRVEVRGEQREGGRKAAILLEVLLPIPLQFSGLHYWQCRVVEQCMRSTTVIYHLNGLDNSSGGARLSSYWIFGKDALDITRVIKIIIFITQTQCQPQHNLS